VLLAAGGRFLAEMRIMPFTSTLESSLDKLRAPLASARPELPGQLEHGLHWTARERVSI